jgi:hypothetical protein
MDRDAQVIERIATRAANDSDLDSVAELPLHKGELAHGLCRPAGVGINLLKNV